MQGTLNTTLATQLAAAQSALAGTTNSLNATINQLTASVAADEANIAALTTQLTQVNALYHLLSATSPWSRYSIAHTEPPQCGKLIQHLMGSKWHPKHQGPKR